MFLKHLWIVGTLLWVGLFAGGLEYQWHSPRIGQSVHVLFVDPLQHQRVAVHALDQFVGRETVLSMANRYGAVAAVNGGFFEIGKNDGRPTGILKINGQWYGLPRKPRGAIGWNEERVLFDRLLTHMEGSDIVVDSCTGVWSSEDWAEMQYIVGGTPLLLQNGIKVTDFSPEQTLHSFLVCPHARTAVGVLADGRWVFAIVDGDLLGGYLGMSISELADYMESLGCTDALNLDGGGSSTFIYEATVKNHPKGDGDDDDLGVRKLRPVSDAILIL